MALMKALALGYSAVNLSVMTCSMCFSMTEMLQFVNSVLFCKNLLLSLPHSL